MGAVLLLLWIAVLVWMIYAGIKTGLRKKGEDKNEGENQVHVFYCKNCGARIVSRGKNWQCGWCGDCGHFR